MKLLIDGPSIFARMYFISSDEDETEYAPIFRTVNYILGLLRDFEPTETAIAWDSDYLFRKDWFPQYKAGRKEKPPDYYPKMGMTERLLEDAGFACVSLDGYEADDLLFNLSDNNEQCVIVSSDKDMLQYVTDSTTLELLTWSKDKGAGRRRFATPESVKEYIGVYPHQVADYKAIVGDSSDNFPGAIGVGKAKVVPLLEKFGNLTEVFSGRLSGKFPKKGNGDEPAWVEKLFAQEEQVWLCWKLARPIEVEIVFYSLPMPTPAVADIFTAVNKFKKQLGL